MYWWLSFRDPDKNLHLGCCNVEAEDQISAARKAYELGINPGGEVLIIPLEAPELELDRLYSRQELLDLQYGFIGAEPVEGRWL